VTNERILVVDDEKGVVRSCVRILERAGYTVSGRTDSLSVPKLLKQESFDLLLTDIKMPKMDGLELLGVAKEIDPHMTVVLITGFGTMEDAIRAIRLGAQGFLMKPFEPKELVATVSDNLARRALIRDSLRLQTLLPLLEINQILQVSGGEVSLVQRVLAVAQREIGATRLAWLSYRPTPAGSEPVRELVQVVVVPEDKISSDFPETAVKQVLDTKHPVWMLSDGTLTEHSEGQPNITVAMLPLIVKGEVAGVLIAEAGSDGRTGPFGQISLELLSVLSGQLAIIIENVQLFQQAETLRALNEDIIRNMTNGLIAIDKQKYLTAFNPAASVMLGTEVVEALHQPMSKAINGVEELIEEFDRTLATGRPHSVQEITIRRSDGFSLPVSLSTAPLGKDSEKDEPLGVVGVLEDLSERKALEAERRRLDRLAALGEMAAVVAHEIRNPVAGIAAGVDYLARNALEGSVEHEGAAMIQSEIKRVNRILEDILFVARPLQLDLAYNSLPDIIDNVIQRCQPMIEDNQVKVSAEYEVGLPLLNLDSQRFEQVFTNLMLNAIQAMKDGGQLSLRCRFTPPADDSFSETVMITVVDSGPGMPPEVLQRVFEPFFTTKTRGTGLGLSVARRIIEEHRGTICAESNEGQGTRFIIELPVPREG
jgi:PAS domain S-box-containing protein